MELSEQKIHNLHSHTVNIHSLSDDNTCTAQHSHIAILNIENKKFVPISYSFGSPTVLPLLRLFFLHGFVPYQDKHAKLSQNILGACWSVLPSHVINIGAER